MRPFHRRLLLVILPVLLLTGHSPAQPETPAALRQQIDRLQQQIDALRADLEALRRANADLTTENEALRRALARRTQPTDASNHKQPAKQPTPAADPGASTNTPNPATLRKASASPDALFVALVIDYAEHFHDAPLNDEADERARAKAVRQWIKDTRKRLSARAEWLTRIYNLTPPDDHNARDADITILDPITLKPIAHPFRLTFPAKFTDRLADAQLNPSATLWKMRVEMQPRPVFQPDRLTPGPFDYPKFIGPFAGFGYEINIQILAPITLEDATKAAAETQKALTPVDR